MRKALFIPACLMILVSTACVLPAPAPSVTPTPTALVIPTTVVPPTATVPAVITSTPEPVTPTPVLPTFTATIIPQATNTAAVATSTPVPAGSLTPLDVDASKYIDDRSGVSILASLFNAVNRKEYLRAYSYWSADSNVVQTHTYAQFAAGYAQTQSVQAQIGPITGDAGAGNFYFNVPVALTATTTTNTTQYFVGCYTLHQVNPGNFGGNNFVPIQIQKGNVLIANSPSDFPSMIANVCSSQSGSGVSPTTTPAPDDISSGRFLDDRSDGIQVVRSFYNAINRHEYSRAYYYWEPAAATTNLPPFDQFQQGYQTTQSVDLTVGTMTSDAGAGQLYYSVPVTLVSHLDNNQTATYVGCYVMHLAQPAIQATPPFQPMGIRSAKIQQVDNGSDTSALMNTICQQ